MDEDYFWYKMDIPATHNAIEVAGFPKEVNDWVFTKKRKAFEVF